MQSPSGYTTTLTDELPYELDGFHWKVATTRRERVLGKRDHDARGVIDGETIARGVVDEVLVDDAGLALLLVGPP
jgi:hypothetical protein